MTTPCPICSQELIVDEIKSHSTTLLRTSRCYNPFPNNPLHYYGRSYIETSIQKKQLLSSEEFTIDLGYKVVLATVNYDQQKTIIRVRKGQTNLELNFIIPPDFPDLLHFKKKVATALTFS